MPDTPYTPSVEEARLAAGYFADAITEAEFDRMIAKVRADTLREFAGRLPGTGRGGYDRIATAEAARIEKEAGL